MILDNLPLPIFVFLMLAAIIAVFIGVWKSWKEGYKLRAVSFSLLTLWGLEVIVYRIFRDLNVFVNNLWLIVPFGISTIGIATILGGISNYKTAKNDKAKKRFMEGVYFFSIVFAILGILGIYLFYGK